MVPPSFSSLPRRGNMSQDVISVQYILLTPSTAWLSSTALLLSKAGIVMVKRDVSPSLLSSSFITTKPSYFVHWAAFCGSSSSNSDSKLSLLQLPLEPHV